MKNKKRTLAWAVAATLSLFATAACDSGSGSGGHAKEFSFSYDNPRESGMGQAVDMFADRLSELSGGALSIKHFPSAQLGDQTASLKSVIAGDIDFAVSATANATGVAPQAAVWSLHYLFEDVEHYREALSDPEINEVFFDMIDDSVDGAKGLALHTIGMRGYYSSEAVRTVEDIRGAKMRVQATPTEDLFWGAYGAQTVHLPFPDVYSALQTGVIDSAENTIPDYFQNRHFESAKVYSLTQHAPSTVMFWISEKTWDSLTAEEQGWIEEAGAQVSAKHPDIAFGLEADVLEQLDERGVTIVEDVDKSGFMDIARPHQDAVAKDLGPAAEEIVRLIRGLRQ